MHFTQFSPFSTHTRLFTDQFWHSQNRLTSEKNYLYVLQELRTKYKQHLTKAQESKPWLTFKTALSNMYGTFCLREQTKSSLK